MNIDLEALGITKEELQTRVIDGICDRFLFGLDSAPDEAEKFAKTTLFKQLENVIQQRADNAIAAIADKYVIPNAVNYLENICLQETNKWGEKTGEKLTFIEYLVKRAEAYLTEQVDYQGKTKAQDSYNWRGVQTRITHLIHEHLQYNIERAMKQAIGDANKHIVGGLEQAVKIKLNEIAQQLKVEVKTK